VGSHRTEHQCGFVVARMDDPELIDVVHGDRLHQGTTVHGTGSWPQISGITSPALHR
jgi:hypothetical protein